MIAAFLLIFLIGYIAIVFEHSLKLDKLASALAMGVLMWTLASVGVQSGALSLVDDAGMVFSSATPGTGDAMHALTEILLHHLGKISEIILFLIGAMVMVELIDLHKGFDVIRKVIRTQNKRKLLWISGIIAFILSAIIDNLTTIIILISILRKMVPDKTDRIWYVSLGIMAANAGGAWSPIGDVTTTMLWIGERITTGKLITEVALPSLVCFLVPYAIASRRKVFDGSLTVSAESTNLQSSELLPSSKKMLFAGLALIAFVPIFKALTHLPPYAGMMFSLSVFWMLATYLTPDEKEGQPAANALSPHHALSRIEMSSILFFLGILLAIAAFESVAYEGVSLLRNGADTVSAVVPNQHIVAILLGIVSAVIDNVPLVAAAMGMYTMPLDDEMWHFIAYTAGTGGSLLVVGSAAGVAAMGMEKIDFIWYLKRITLLTFIGYAAGCAVFLLL